jgi:integrase
VPYGPNTVGTFNRRVKEKSKIDFSCHRLRHTFATRWLARGGNIVALQKVLGHSDLELTQRYADAAEEFVRAEARKVGAWVAPKNGDETVTEARETAQVVGMARSRKPS